MKDVHGIEVTDLSPFYYVHHSDKSLSIPTVSNCIRQNLIEKLNIKEVFCHGINLEEILTSFEA